ncbi:MAG: tRNA (guanosine(46)-N7)-methyltransferase TrmB [Clostridia bacterium]|nr:tRNA (guanosine(46)-N7)-methyltransferase TrmB [Clostridia bacterium]
MRIRRKKWAKDELEKAQFYIDNPTEFKNLWNKKFENEQPIYLELGCGKGLFIATLAKKHPEINFIAVDMIEAMLGLSKRNIEQSYNGEKIKNILLIRANVERILDTFGENDKVDRIYINFCNPWPKDKHKKRRLTHIRQLENYKKILKQNGQIYFKTDDDGLFEESLEYFKEAGFEVEKLTYDLHNEMIFEENVVTEHEKMFTEQGIKIKALIARYDM